MKIFHTALILFNALTTIVSTEAADAVSYEYTGVDVNVGLDCLELYYYNSPSSDAQMVPCTYSGTAVTTCEFLPTEEDMAKECSWTPVITTYPPTPTCPVCPPTPTCPTPAPSAIISDETVAAMKYVKHASDEDLEAFICIVRGECTIFKNKKEVDLNKTNEGRRRRALSSDEQVLLDPEFDDCWEEMYVNALYADSSHVSFLAVPKNKASNCPIIALDNGFSEGANFEQGGVLAPMLTILHEVPEEVLFLDYTISLMDFFEAINKLIPANYLISENEYNIVHNNCATYMLDLAKEVGLDYKDPNTATNIENYVGKSIASNDITVGKIRKAYLEQNEGIYHKASFYVWNFAVGDEGMTRALVRSYMNKMVEE